MEEEKNNQPLYQEPIDYDLYSKHLDQIKKEAEGDAPLIGKKESINALKEEFENNQPFINKIQFLVNIYPTIRRIRRDGSCFYRSYLFQIFEHIVITKDKDFHQKIQNIIKQSKDDLIKAEYQEFVLDDFYDNIMEQLANTINQDFGIDNLYNMFNDKSISDYLVMYLRFMTSGYLKNNAILYENFIENGMSIHQFCQAEVDPLDKEADQIPMMALINYLNVPIKIIYLNSNPTKTEPNTIILPEGIDEKDVFVNLLYRPGHYDIAYKN